MIPIPDYLKQYAVGKKQKGSRLSFKLKCTCGCEKFIIWEKEYTDDEKHLIQEYEDKIPHTGWHSIYGGLDTEGKPYSYIKYFGIFKKRVDFPQIPVCMNMNVIKAVCLQCQNDVVLFDSRTHGYDGMTSDHTEERNCIPHFKQRGNTPYSVEVAIENQPSLEAFNEMMEEQHSFAFYSNSFTSIRICGLGAKGKKELLYDIETA
jgi:hypothetical protein